MADWKTNKGSGPWDFTEQLNKWGYLNNPRWSSQQDSINFCKGLGLETGPSNEHKPCGHWHKAKDFPITGGRWVAAMQQPGTPYIYVYDILYKAVIRIDTSEIPVFVSGRLELDSAYGLDYDMGQGNPGTQRGGYCMNKDGTRVWYLFTESDGDRIDAELIEVDISGFFMEKVKSTHFINLVAPGAISDERERINDSCSNDTYTYWCTNLIAGRIIKIRNSDHSIIDDHYFNYPVEGCTGGGFDEAIATIDVNKDTEKLYWAYCRDHSYCVPAYNACRHLIRANLSLVADIDDIVCGSGFSSPGWQNIIRVYLNQILHHRVYHPSSGYLMKRDLDYTLNDFIEQEYLQNIFGIKDDKLFTLVYPNNISEPAYLHCINFFNMTEVSKLSVSYYTGHGYLSDYDWDWTCVSAMNYQTGVIAIFRYHNIEKVNYAGCFNADSDLGFLCDVKFDRIYDDPTLGPFGEPQMWVMPSDEVPVPAKPIPPGPIPGLPCVGQSSKLSQDSISVSVTEGSDAANYSIKVTDNCNFSLAFQVEEVNNNNWITWISSPVVGGTGNGTLNVSFNTISLSAGNYSGSIVISTALGNLTLNISLVVTSSPNHGEATGITLIKGDVYRRFDFRAGEVKLFKFKANSGPTLPQLATVTEVMSHYSDGDLQMLVRYAGQNWETAPPNDSDYANIWAYVIANPYEYTGLFGDIYYYMGQFLTKSLYINLDPLVTDGCFYFWVKNNGSKKLNDCMVHFQVRE